MTIDELRDALTILAQDDPDFLKELIGDVIKENLQIDKRSDGDFYRPEEIHVLKWDGYNKEHEFSVAY